MGRDRKAAAQRVADAEAKAAKRADRAEADAATKSKEISTLKESLRAAESRIDWADSEARDEARRSESARREMDAKLRDAERDANKLRDARRDDAKKAAKEKDLASQRLRSAEGEIRRRDQELAKLRAEVASASAAAATAEEKAAKATEAAKAKEKAKEKAKDARENDAANANANAEALEALAAARRRADQLEAELAAERRGAAAAATAAAAHTPKDRRLGGLGRRRFGRFGRGRRRRLRRRARGSRTRIPRRWSFRLRRRRRRRGGRFEPRRFEPERESKREFDVRARIVFRRRRTETVERVGRVGRGRRCDDGAARGVPVRQFLRRRRSRRARKRIVGRGGGEVAVSDVGVETRAGSISGVAFAVWFLPDSSRKEMKHCDTVATPRDARCALDVDETRHVG